MKLGTFYTDVTNYRIKYQLDRYLTLYRRIASAHREQFDMSQLGHLQSAEKTWEGSCIWKDICHTLTVKFHDAEDFICGNFSLSLARAFFSKLVFLAFARICFSMRSLHTQKNKENLDFPK